MEGQMTIFDFLPGDGDLDTMSIEQAAEEIGNALSCIFVYNSFHGWYEAKVKGLMLAIEFDNYDTMDELNGRRFLGVEWSIKKGSAGGGKPCDTIQEAIDYFKRRMSEEVKR